MCDLLRMLVGQGGGRRGVSALRFFVAVTHWITLSVEVAIKLGCPHVSMDLIIVKKLYLLKGI